MRRLLPVALLALAGCPKNVKLPDLSAYTPKVSFSGVELGKPSWEGVDAQFMLTVDNPNPVGVSLARWSWDLDIAERDFLAGTDDDGVRLEPSGDSQLAIPARLVFAELVETARAARGQDEVPFAVSGELGFATPLGVVTVPWADDGTLPVLRRPQVSLEALRVERLDLLKGRAELALDLGVTNPGGAALGLTDMAWTLDLGGKTVADGQSADLGSVAAGQTATLTLPIGVNVVQLGSTVVQALKNKSDVAVALDASTSVDTPLGPLPLTIDQARTLTVR